MQVLIIILGIILALWLIGKLFIFLFEGFCKYTDDVSYRRKRRAIEQDHRKQKDAEEKRIVPLVKKYQNSVFFATLVNQLERQGAFDRRYPVKQLYLRSCSITLYKHNNTPQTLYFEELGYQSLPNDDHLKAVARILHSRLGGSYLESIKDIDLVGSCGIEYIIFTYEQPPVQHNPPLKRTL